MSEIPSGFEPSPENRASEPVASVPSGDERPAQAQPVSEAASGDQARPAATMRSAGEQPSAPYAEPLPSADRTESFAEARMGDTQTMPAAEAPAQPAGALRPAQAAPVSYELYADQAIPAQQTSEPARFQPSGQPAQAPADMGQAQRGAYAAPTLQSGYASQQPSGSPYGATQQPAPAPGYNPAQTGQPAYAAPAARAQQGPQGQQGKPRKATGGAGKTFLFGFLGAALACALAFGGVALAGGFANRGTALIGTTDQSVINAVDEGQTLAEAVAQKALPSVVAIYNYQKQSASYGYGFGYGYGVGNQDADSLVATGMGSGVVISDDGYILTNYHVVEDAAKLTVSVNGVERDASYVGGDSSSDIAVIKVEDTEGLVTADIGDSDSLRIGEWVMTIGAPLGLESSVATGVVSATNRSTIMDSSSNSGDLYSYFYGSSTPEYTYYPNMIQTDAVINPGNSGGALVDADGKLIGINAMISSYSGDYAGVGFAIPINYAISLAQDVIDGKEPTHAMMGVSLSQVNSTIASRYNLSTDSGAYISAITPDTGAADSDLQVGDIIVKIDGKAVKSPTDVTLSIRAHKVGDKVTATVNRDGEEVDVEVVLSSDESMVSASAESEDEAQQQDDGRGQRDDGGWGDVDGRGNGQGNGYDIDELEELLKLLGR